MTTDELIAKLRAQWSVIDQAFALAVSTTHGRVATRIFQEGKNGSGSEIGKYDSTHPLYVNPKYAPVKFTPQGKNQKKPLKTKIFSIKENKKGKHSAKYISIKKDFTERKTKWFSSYKAFRETEGRETNFVNLNLWGRLQSDYVNSLKKRRDGNWTSGVKTLESEKKVFGIERKYGNVFLLQESEKQLLNNTFQAELIRLQK